jgi:hypothetical protein
MILNFDTYVNEKYKTVPAEKPEITSSKNYLNDIQASIEEYRTKRRELDNIYMNYKSEAELRMKLQDFQRRLGKGEQRVVKKVKTQANPKDPVSFQFINPLFNLHSQISAKKRQIAIKEKDLKKQKDTLVDREQSSEGSEDELKSSFAEDIEVTNDKIKDLQDDIKKIYQDIADVERQIRLKLEAMRKEMTTNGAILNKQILKDTSP